MIFTHKEDVEEGYVWKCPFCYKTVNPTTSTIMSCMGVKKLDTALTLWMMNSKSLQASKMIAHRARNMAKPAIDYFHLFRKAFDLYVKKMILPYL